MKRKHLLKKILVTILLAFIATGAMAQQWVVYTGDVLPNDASLAPNAFVTAGISAAGGTYAIISDPDILGNNLLTTQTAANADNFLWRRNYSPTQVTKATVVIRAKSPGGTNNALLEMDLDFGGSRQRVTILMDSTYRRESAPLPNTGELGVSPLDWNVYRFTKDAGGVRLYINETEIPLFSEAALTGSNQHFRIGDGAGGAHMNALIDWIVYDTSGAYSPSTSPLPAGLTGATATITTLSSLTEFSQLEGAPSNNQTYMVQGGNLGGDVVITPPLNYEVSADDGASWFNNATPLILSHSGGTVAAATITVRLNAAVAGSYSGDISHTSTGAPAVNVAVNGVTGSPPVIDTIGILQVFSQIIGNPSDIQTYSVSGNELTGDVTITPPVNFEVSADAGANWFNSASPLVLPQSGGVVGSTTISVRLNASSAGNHSGSIVHSSPGAVDINVAVNGATALTGPPELIVSGALDSFSQMIGSPSDVQTYTVSGRNLTGNIVITPPVNYQVSANAGTIWKSNASPLVLAPSAGHVDETTITVRLIANVTGSFAGNIVHTTPGDTTVIVQIAGDAVEELVTGLTERRTPLLSVSPNPAYDNLVVSNAVINGGFISLYSITGMKLGSYDVPCSVEKTVIYVGDMAEGIYLVEWQNGRERITSRFIKK